MPSFRIEALAIPAVSLLIAFLAGSSQLLFYFLEPGPLLPGQSIRFNILIAALLVSYARSCSTDPGYVETLASVRNSNQEGEIADPAARWCRKCNGPKPPRAHHCKVCQRCVMKMDHHCPWTANCTGYRTFPHFIRFLFYAVVAMLYLGYFLALRMLAIWSQRRVSRYLGPSSWALGHLITLFAVNLITCFMLFMLLCMSAYCLGANMTAIEGLQIERHKKLLKRARRNGGFVYGPGGIQVRLVRHEFPYDVGIYKNIAQGMGSSLPWMWFWPLAPTPSKSLGVSFETNGFNDDKLTWPPPDPEKMPFNFVRPNDQNGFVHGDDKRQDAEWMETVNQRRLHDLQQRHGQAFELRQRNAGADHDEDSEEIDSTSDESDDNERTRTEPSDDDIPLTTLIERRRQ